MIIRILQAPVAIPQAAHFEVLDWSDGAPVVALGGERVALHAHEGWTWEQIPAP